MRSEMVVGQQAGSGVGEPSAVQLDHHEEQPCSRSSSATFTPQPASLNTPQREFREPELNIGLINPTCPFSRVVQKLFF